MTFNEAWDERLVTIDKGSVDVKNIQAELYFEGGMASMIMPGYFKAVLDMKEDMERAWNVLVEREPILEDRVRYIQIVDYSKNKVAPKKVSTRKIA